MKWLLRPSVLIALSVLLVAAAFLVFRPGPSLTPHPSPVGPDDLEVAWLYPATNVSSWERFVAAVERTARAMKDTGRGEFAFDDRAAFPQQTTAVPEVALVFQAGDGQRRRLLFRWYKLTGAWRARPWIDALLTGRRPPLAVIGGNNSYWARELAIHLQDATRSLPPDGRPLLLLTNATADRVPGPDSSGGPTHEVTPSGPRKPASGGHPPAPAWREPPEGEGVDESLAANVALHDLYPGRTFRFCFTNRQMASAVTRFIWSRDELRPDSDPVYTVQWQDDAYSQDLVDGYNSALRKRVRETVAQQWSWVSGCVASGAFPPLTSGGVFPLHLAGQHGTSITLEGLEPVLIDSSVGSFATPNVYEARAVQLLLEQTQSRAARLLGPFPMPFVGDAAQGPAAQPEFPAVPPQRRPLLVVTGQAQPSRRLLRDLARSAPQTSWRFVVAMGDSLSFNNVYRDRLATWPIQDLPFSLVFFCHLNPIDASAGFRPQADAPGAGGPGADRVPADQDGETCASAGTEDLLLYGQIVESLLLCVGEKPALPVEGGQGEGASVRDGGSAGRQLARLRWHPDGLALGGDGPLLFRPDGQRASGTGEHVVYLQPKLELHTVRAEERRARGRRVLVERVEGRVLPEATIEVWAWQRIEEPLRVWRPVAPPLRVRYEEPLTLESEG